jgi:hypothetical protein
LLAPKRTLRDVCYASVIGARRREADIKFCPPKETFRSSSLGPVLSS